MTASDAFQSWSGDLSGSANPQSISMTAPRSVTATFQPLPPPPSVAWVVPGTSNPIPGTLDPTQQQSVQVSALNSYAAPVTGQLNLVFVPDAVNNADDPNVVFTTGGRRLNFTIPANSSLAQFQVPNVMVQAGTVAGTIMITANLQVGDVDITPSPTPVHRIVVNQMPPVLIDDVRIVRTPAGFEVEVSGYSTTREIRQAVFRFTPAENRAYLKTSELTIDVSNAATSWFLSAPSSATGGAFHYVQPFTVQGDVTDIGSISVTLVNMRGNSTARSGRF